MPFVTACVVALAVHGVQLKHVFGDVQPHNLLAVQGANSCPALIPV